MNAATMRRFLSALVIGAALMGASGPALAQANPQVYGGFGAEDGYNDDGFGWGPAYRPETTFRPSYGFYGGVERPYPYARPPQPVVVDRAPRRVVRRKIISQHAHRAPRRAVVWLGAAY
jgi:hypothetical protein